jgi:hypothetical protein
MDCDYRVKFMGVGVCFADREVEWLLQKARRGVSTPIVLYGPEEELEASGEVKRAVASVARAIGGDVASFLAEAVLAVGEVFAKRLGLRRIESLALLLDDVF